MEHAGRHLPPFDQVLATAAILSALILPCVAPAAHADQTAVNQAMNDVNAQAAQRQARAANGFNRANDKAADAANRAQWINGRAQYHASSMSNATDYWGRPKYSQSYIDQYLELRNQKANNAQHAMTSEANQIADTAQQRSEAVQQHAYSIGQQLKQSVTQGDSYQMVPQGTNLYVQNYSAPVTPPATPMKAIPKTLQRTR